VAVDVVDQLEVVQVEQQQGERTLEAGRALDLLADRHREVAVVPQAGERVGQRQPAGLLVQLHVVDATVAWLVKVRSVARSASSNGSPSSRS
jgi:transposase